MADRVELEIELKKYQDAVNSLENLKRIKEDLNRHKTSLEFDNTEAKRKIEELKREITDFTKKVNAGKIDISDEDFQKKIKEYNDELVKAQRHQKDISYEVESTRNMISSLEPEYKKANAAVSEQEKIVNNLTKEIEKAEAAEQKQAETEQKQAEAAALAAEKEREK